MGEGLGKRLLFIVIVEACYVSYHEEKNLGSNFNIPPSLVQNLLLNAKLRFAEASDSSGVELCDTYLSRVDLLRLLVSARYSKIPSIQELTKSDLARRVRDRLIKDDRFGLAMEVSTKCQLDTGAVWSAWGVACLKSGDFMEARSKLKHCFQVGVAGWMWSVGYGP